tara:strand:- start:121 stop:579 length:459 start_codon:yes stop_codon:yes gene_type:complete
MTNQSTDINELLNSNDPEQNNLVQEIINEMKEQQNEDKQSNQTQQKNFTKKMEAVPHSVKQTSMSHHPFMKEDDRSNSQPLNFSSINNIRFLKEIVFVILLNYFLNTNIVNKLLLKIPQFVSSDNLNIPNFIGIMVKAIIAGILFIILKLVI